MKIVRIVFDLHGVIVNSIRVVLCIFYFILNILSRELLRKTAPKYCIHNKMNFEVQWLNGWCKVKSVYKPGGPSGQSFSMFQ